MPTVSTDGLTWSIEMRPGQRYAPPYADREIVAADVVEAIERNARLGSYWSPYFRPIVGYDAFAAGRTPSIRGLQTPDDYTLVARLKEPAGDLPERLSLAGTAPIPHGAATGHDDDYVRFAIASGPYMLLGSDELTPWLPPEEQRPAKGWKDGSVILVRNPSWDPASDDLRSALPGRIRFELIASGKETVEAFADARVDVVATNAAGLIRKVERGDLPGSVAFGEATMEQHAPLNLAVPPFDDVHVRRAVNLVVDRDLFARGSSAVAATSTLPTWHLVPSAIQAYRVDPGWRPTWARGASTGGDIEMAMAEMRLSRYDGDRDGRCDGPRCVIRSADMFRWPGIDQSFVRPFDRLGITLRVDERAGPPDWFAPEALVPSERFGFSFLSAWAPDWPSASTWVPVWSGRFISEQGNWNLSLLGAAGAQLRGWGYRVRSVPSVDDRIDRCLELTGESQDGCWAELDMYLMEDVVPAIPLTELGSAALVSDRVVEAPIGVAVGNVSYDRVALAPEGGDTR
jgi:peptide/nickel transport system substrate-binding protein